MSEELSKRVQELELLVQCLQRENKALKNSITRMGGFTDWENVLVNENREYEDKLRELLGRRKASECKS